jgi:hypothetical protein
MWEVVMREALKESLGFIGASWQVLLLVFVMVGVFRWLFRWPLAYLEWVVVNLLYALAALFFLFPMIA